MKKETSLKQTM